MNKILFFCAFQLFFISIYAQNFEEDINLISENLAKKLCTEILNKRDEIKKWTGASENVSINLNYIENFQGEQTKLSDELGKLIAHNLSVEFNKSIIKLADLTTTYGNNFTKYENIENIKKSDFTLSGRYSYAQNKIVFSMFKLEHLKTANRIDFKRVVIKNKNIDSLKKYYEKNIVKNPFEEFMNVQKQTSFVKNIEFTKDKIPTPKVHIAGTGDVFEINYKITYNIGLVLKQNTYIYAFFYDPLDKQNDFIRIIPFDEKKYSAGKYNDILPFDLEFYPTQNTQEYCYIKFIFSKNRINIKSYQSEVYDSENEKSIIINKNNCSKITEQLKNLKNVQTKTIVLTFE